MSSVRHDVHLALAVARLTEVLHGLRTTIWVHPVVLAIYNPSVRSEPELELDMQTILTDKRDGDLERMYAIYERPPRVRTRCEEVG